MNYFSLNIYYILTLKSEKLNYRSMDTVVKQFIQAYYTCVMTNRSEAYVMYSEDSFMSYNGENVQGRENIQKKFNSFSFKTINVIFICTILINY